MEGASSTEIWQKPPDDAFTQLMQRAFQPNPNEIRAVLSEMARLDAWKDDLLLNDKGAPRANLANAAHVAEFSPDLRGKLAFCEFSGRPVFLPGKIAPWDYSPSEQPSPWTDRDSSEFAVYLQREHAINVSSLIAHEAAVTVARRQPFHPVRNYLEGLKWDGVSRLEQVMPLYFGAANNEYTRAVGRCFLISAVARIFQPGCKADGCLVLEGKQGSLKSSALRVLGGPWFTDEISDLGSKDSSIQTQGVWLIELSELDSLSRVETGQIKAFISRSVDRYRPPYGRQTIDSPRQCVFAGTVNHDVYLRDETGGRRFWPVACTTIHIDELARDRNQLWAEALYLYKQGTPWWLDTTELNTVAAEEQAQRYEADPWEGPVAEWIRSKDDIGLEELLADCLLVPRAQWTQPSKTRLVRILTSLKWVRYRPGPRGSRGYRYRPAQ